MIRGISRQIVEITETNNSYFDRAFLVLRPEYAQAERYKIERAARSLLASVDRPSKIKKRRLYLYWFTRLAAAALIGAAIATAVFLL